MTLHRTFGVVAPQIAPTGYRPPLRAPLGVCGEVACHERFCKGAWGQAGGATVKRRGAQGLWGRAPARFNN